MLNIVEIKPERPDWDGLDMDGGEPVNISAGGCRGWSPAGRKQRGDLWTWRKRARMKLVGVREEEAEERIRMEADDWLWLEKIVNVGGGV